MRLNLRSLDNRVRVILIILSSVSTLVLLTKEKDISPPFFSIRKEVGSHLVRVGRQSQYERNRKIILYVICIYYF